ncbi:hypothetical protein ccbrp13_09600 [Ktedonobacteria bacterium brp13]|nr:hypothetical protein ccbrp13_09600 [Ktedonobacteria bacterium brp13]
MFQSISRFSAKWSERFVVIHNSIDAYDLTFYALWFIRVISFKIKKRSLDSYKLLDVLVEWE